MKKEIMFKGHTASYGASRIQLLCSVTSGDTDANILVHHKLKEHIRKFEMDHGVTLEWEETMETRGQCQ